MKTLPTSLLLTIAVTSASALHAAVPRPATAPKAPQVVVAPSAAQAPAAPPAARAPEAAVAPHGFAIITPDSFEPFEPLEAFDFATAIPEPFEVAPIANLSELSQLSELSRLPMMYGFGQQGDSKPDKSPSGTDPVYDAGLKAMDEARWSDAVKQFDKVAAGKSDRVEAALYWKAYSLEKIGRGDDASAACEKLRTDRPASRWNRDCTVLRMQNGQRVFTLKQDDLNERVMDAQVRASDAVQRAKMYRIDARDYVDVAPRDPNDEIKLIALNSVLQQKPSEAVPMLRSYILSDRPVSERRRALFILARSKAPEAQALLTEIANNKTDTSLQRAAVQTLATGRGKQAGPELLTIYRNSTDKEVKRAAVSGLFVAGDATDLVELARSEKDLNMKREIVTQLALMHDPAATAYMEELLK